MKKRAAPRKISDTRKEKETSRKVKTVSGISEKTKEKKEGKVAPRGGGEKKIKTVRGKEKQEPIRKKISAEPEKTKKTKAERKSERKITKAEVSGKKKTEKVATATRRIRKAKEKTPPKRKEKVPPKAVGKVGVRKKLAQQTAEKRKAGVVSEVPEKEKTSGRIVKKKVASSGVREVVGGRTIAEAETKERQRKVIKGVGEVQGLREKAEAGQGEAGRLEEEKGVFGVQKAGVQKGIEEEEARLPTLGAVLPESYGENSVTLMTVDPYRLFAFWEVREETLKIFRGEVAIRIYDVTDIDFDTMDANSYFDMRAEARIGKCYVSVNPEREYLADIGIIFDGIFIAIARSARVSTPRPAVSEEGILLSGPGETGLRAGY